jgi:hypothetical protein
VLPEGYLDALRDELAPFGLEYDSATEDDGVTAVVFTTDPESFVRAHPQLGIEESYGRNWPPARLELRLEYELGDPTQVEFETIDLLAQTASTHPSLRDRLNTLADPADQAAAVGEALAEALAEPEQAEAF